MFFTISNLLRNSADNLSLVPSLATATTNGLVLLQLGEVKPSAIISEIISSDTGVGRKSRVDLREDAKELKFSGLNSLSMTHCKVNCYFIGSIAEGCLKI